MIIKRYQCTVEVCISTAWLWNYDELIYAFDCSSNSSRVFQYSDNYGDLILILNFPRGSQATTKRGKIDESFKQS